LQEMPRDCEAFLFGWSAGSSFARRSGLAFGPFLMAPVATFGVLSCLFSLLSVVAKRVELCAQSSLFAVQERSI
jgi:hypothetical protein